ncbi:alpha/beta hydrolase family protein [Marinimicrobium locisalis]|uniref:alpha/beta hydrolase family protein n=1 Tax=Marinimicrobium locisalis TaxID=546022 RepID=UPI003221A315
MRSNVRLSVIISLLLAVSALGAKPGWAAGGAEAFFRFPDMVDARLRPDGAGVAGVRMSAGSAAVVYSDLERDEERQLFDVTDYAGGESAIGPVVWIDNQYLAIQLHESVEGIAQLLETKVSSRLLIVDTLEKSADIYSVRTPGELVDPLPEEAGTLLYSKSGSVSKVYRLTVSKLTVDRKPLGKLDLVDGGQFVSDNELFSIEGYVHAWHLGQDSKSSMALRLNREEEALQLVHLHVEEGTPEVFESWPLDDSESEQKVIPVARAEGETEFYGVDVTDQERQTLYKIDYRADTQEEVYRTQAYRILDVLTSPNHELIGVKVVRDGAVSYEYVGQEADASPGEQSEQLRVVIDRSTHKGRALVYRERHNLPGRFMLVDDKGAVLQQVGEVAPVPSGLESARLEQATVTVEGLEIPYLLNLPSSLPTSEKSVPLVVLPHGGPEGLYDTPYYDPVAAYFVANGMAALRVNYRGSGGISSAHQQAGQGQWGRLMLEDIHRAVLEVKKRPDIDGRRVCLVGASYGAYAALSLAIQHGGDYQCVAAISGVYDLNLLVNSTDLNDTQREQLVELMGVSAQETDALMQLSPLYNLQDWSVPLFLAHGGEDRISDMEHSHRVNKLLEARGFSHEWYFDAHAGHSFIDPEQRRALYSDVYRFVHRQLEREAGSSN